MYPHPEPEPGGAPVTGADAPATGADRTGQPRVDAAMEELERLTGLDPADQVAGYTEVHRQLQATLAALDEGR
jgi:hypothetical protein